MQRPQLFRLIESLESGKTLLKFNIVLQQITLNIFDLIVVPFAACNGPYFTIITTIDLAMLILFSGLMAF